MKNYEPVLPSAILFSDLIVREERSRKLSLIGCFQHFFSTKFPITVAPFYVSVFVTNLFGELGAMTATARIEDEEGNVVQSVTWQTSGVPNENQVQIKKTDIADLVFPIPPTMFPKPGIYEVSVYINNEKLGSRPLTVKEVSAS
jgi:hypothetical protein